MGLISLLTKGHGRALFLPAHGRGVGLPRELRALLKNRPGVWDLPDLPEIGGPLIRDGAVFESQKESAEVFGAKRLWYGVNGATGLLQAALLSVARPGQAVLMPRNVHRSLIQACLLGDVTPVFFEIPFLVDRGHFLPPDEKLLLEVLEYLNHYQLKVAAAVLVHPTYHGYAQDIKPLIDQLHRRGLPVLVDEAHGTHFAFVDDDSLPQSALTSGADLVVHSLHKSAGGLTQTAALWLKGDRVDPVIIDRSISWIQTTSPSSLLLASCEASIRDLSSSVGRKNLKRRLDEAKEIESRLREFGLPLLKTQDPLRLIWHTALVGISGLEVDQWLISKGLFAELPEPGSLLFCLGFANQRGLSSLMQRLWTEMISRNRWGGIPLRFVGPPIPKVSFNRMKLRDAWNAPTQRLALRKAVGKISAELICPYPPGIPLLIPGEKLDEDRVCWLIDQNRLWPNQVSSHISVVSEA